MISLNAYAKINWTLDILNKREDGYHEMDMLMQSIDLHDVITLETAEEISLQPALDNAPQNSPSTPIVYDETNLVIRAAHALCQYVKKSAGVKITLKKNIPSEAGLGGGSADAAAVLIGLNQYWRFGISNAALLEIGAGLGADIPFLLTGGFARVNGLGEIIQPLPALKKRYLILIQPCRGLSTPEVFKAYDRSEQIALRHPDNDRVSDILLHNRDVLLRQYAANVMEPINVKHYPKIGTAIDALYANRCDYAAMTGSGSVVFGSFAEEGRRDAAFSILQKEYRWIWRTETR